jgi:hypothetical protein
MHETTHAYGLIHIHAPHTFMYAHTYTGLHIHACIFTRTLVHTHVHVHVSPHVHSGLAHLFAGLGSYFESCVLVALCRALHSSLSP